MTHKELEYNKYNASKRIHHKIYVIKILAKVCFN